QSALKSYNVGNDFRSPNDKPSPSARIPEYPSRGIQEYNIAASKRDPSLGGKGHPVLTEYVGELVGVPEDQKEWSWRLRHGDKYGSRARGGGSVHSSRLTFPREWRWTRPPTRSTWPTTRTATPRRAPR